MKPLVAGLLLSMLVAVVAAANPVDGWGRDVDLSGRPPERIAALAPHLAESLFALGFGPRIVATVAFADHPPEARDVPRVGDAFALSWEALTAVRPDWILAWGATLTPARLARLEALGVPVFVSEPNSLADVARELSILTDVLGGDGGLAQDFLRRMEALPGNRAGAARRVLPLISSRPPMTLSRDHFVEDVLAHCGAANPFAGTAGPVAQLSQEHLLVADLDLLLNLSSAPLPEGLRLPPGVVVVELDPDLLVRPGPRVIEGAEALCARLAELP